MTRDSFAMRGFWMAGLANNITKGEIRTKRRRRRRRRAVKKNILSSFVNKFKSLWWPSHYTFFLDREFII